jgi:hypothetical protein
MKKVICILAVGLLILGWQFSNTYANDYLIWDPCDHTSATIFNNQLIEQGYTGIITNDIYGYIENFSDYNPLIFFPECSYNSEIDEILIDIQDEVGNYLNNGGSLYWEGANIALFNDYYREVIFGFDMTTCISDPFTELYGESQSFETLAFATSQTSAPTIVGGDGCAFSTFVNCPDKAIFRDGTYRAILTSFPFYCINNDGQNNRSDYVNSVMCWLTNTMDVNEQDNPLPTKFTTMEAYPNPFNAQTLIRFDLPQSANIKLNIYNVLGQPVINLFNGFCQAGEQSFIWNGDSFSSGIYFVRLEYGNYTENAKLVLLK